MGEEFLNLFAQQKGAGYPYSGTQSTGPRKAGEAGLVHSTPIIDPTQPVQKAVTQPAPVQKTTPTKTTPVYTGGSTDPNAGADYLASLLTTPQREEELRKQSVQRQRIMAVGDALRHIGNIFNTVNGAPSQKFSSPVEDERKRYLQEKALRDANNYKYMSYQQAKAAQDAKMRQAERQLQYNAALNAAKMQAQQSQWDAQNKETARFHDLTNALNVRRQDALERHQEETRKDQKRRTDIMDRRANHYINGGGGRSRGGGSNMPDYEIITENTLNDDGRVISQKKTRTVKRDGQSTTSTKTTKKPLPGQAVSTNTAKSKKKLP